MEIKNIFHKSDNHEYFMFSHWNKVIWPKKQALTDLTEGKA